MKEHDREETVELIGSVGISKRQHAAHVSHTVHLQTQQLLASARSIMCSGMTAKIVSCGVIGACVLSQNMQTYIFQTYIDGK